MGKEKADNGGSRDLGSVDLEMDLGEKLDLVSISRFWGGWMTRTGRWREIERGVAWRGEFGRELPKRKRPRRRGEDHGGLEGGPFTWVRD